MKFQLCIISLLLVGYATHSQASDDAAISASTQLSTTQPSTTQLSTISKSRWIHGSADCDTNQDPVIDVYQHDKQSFIMRQNKCLTYEAPFIYILVGEQKVLVLDTGALDDPKKFSLYAELEKILGKEPLTSKEILVIHSHSHSDHYSGDAAFVDQPNVKLINTTTADVKQFFGFTDWPQGQKTIDLGARQITVIATPGHQEEAISLYDQQNQWLITGDTLYPGYIYVKDWSAYRDSIDRLATFANNHHVAAILGAHIEMENKPTAYYPIGTTFQPDEAKLDLAVQSLYRLNTRLKEMTKPQELIFDDFIINPMNGLQKTLSNMARWFTN